MLPTVTVHPGDQQTGVLSEVTVTKTVTVPPSTVISTVYVTKTPAGGESSASGSSGSASSASPSSASPSSPSAILGFAGIEAARVRDGDAARIILGRHIHRQDHRHGDSHGAREGHHTRQQHREPVCGYSEPAPSRRATELVISPVNTHDN
ncbi:hypothetical protein NLG97_g10599 [Lecanicillium saksenae]|uniref:Uncharacterized protein n=1 Tax=Lecanicillium saksenae TaxID=468837 RepID=A0ACC1QFH2_9HYPO|nr:hypothetical protein NLG97_g10599 [Lecanicillium saksenae]